VADGSGFLVEMAPPFDTKTLRHRDLHALDIAPIPDRFEKRIGETKQHEILHRLFAQVVVDAKYRGLLEHRVQGLVESLRGGQVASERLLDDDAGVARASGAS